jgi:hypothetical protein
MSINFVVSVQENFAVKDGEGYGISASDKAQDLGMSYIRSIEWDVDNGSGIIIRDDGNTEVTSFTVVNEFLSLWETAKQQQATSLQEDLPTIKYRKRVEVKYFGRDRGKVGITRTTTSDKQLKLQVRNDQDFRNVQGLAIWAMIEKQTGNENSTIVFRDGNNEEFTLTHDDCFEIYKFVREYFDAIRESVWAHKNAIDQLETAEAVENYDYKSSGWPNLN